MGAKHPASKRWIFLALPALALIALCFSLFRTRTPPTAQRPLQRRLPGAASPLDSGAPLQSPAQPAQLQMFHWEVDANKVGSVGAETALVFLPDDQVATASEDFQVRVWDARDGKLLRTEELDNRIISGPLSSMAFSPDGALLAGIVRGSPLELSSLKLWDVRTGKAKFSFERATGYRGGVSHEATFQFSPDGSTLAGPDTAPRYPREKPPRVPAIGLWSVDTGRLKARIPVTNAPLETDFVSAAFAPDGKTLAIVGGSAGVQRAPGSVTYLKNKGEVTLWDTQTGQIRRTFSGLPTSGTAAAFSPDGSTLAVSHNFGVVTLLDVRTGKILRSLQVKVMGRLGESFMVAGGIHALVYSPDGSMLAGAAYRNVQLWDAATGSFRGSSNLLNPPLYGGPRGGALDVGQVSFSPDSRTLAIGGKSARTVTLWPIK